MKHLAFVFLCLAPAFGQQLQPVTSQQQDCGKFSTPITTAGTFSTAIVDNRQAACDGWVVTYSSNSFATVSVLLQSAPLGLLGIPGTFVSFAGTITVGPNPATATTQSEIRATGYFPYVRVQITTTGAGYLIAEFHGFKSNPNAAGGATGGCPGTVMTPCVVVGPTAVGSIPTQAPVQMGGQDAASTDTTYIQTDSNGAIVLGNSGGNPQGEGVTTGALNMLGTPLGGGFNNTVQTISYRRTDGTHWAPDFICSNQAQVRLTNATRTALVAPVSLAIVRVCHIHATTDGSSENFTITEGTGSACAGGTTTIDSVLNQLGFAFDFQPTAALRTAASNGLCIAQSGASQNADVTVMYAQF